MRPAHSLRNSSSEITYVCLANDKRQDIRTPEKRTTPGCCPAAEYKQDENDTTHTSKQPTVNHPVDDTLVLRASQLSYDEAPRDSNEPPAQPNPTKSTHRLPHKKTPARYTVKPMHKTSNEICTSKQIILLIFLHQPSSEANTHSPPPPPFTAATPKSQHEAR